MQRRTGISRRDFVERGAGLVIAFCLPPRSHPLPTLGDPEGFAPNAWIRVGTDGLVTLTVDKSEMGQGSQTGLAIILAEELEADWATVRLRPGAPNTRAWAPPKRHGGGDPSPHSRGPARQ